MNAQSTVAARQAVPPPRVPSSSPAHVEQPGTLAPHQTPADVAAADRLDHGPLGHLWVVQGTELRPLPVAGPARPGENYFFDLQASDREIDRLFNNLMAGPAPRARVDPTWVRCSLPLTFALGVYTASRGEYRLLSASLLVATGVDQVVAQHFGRSVYFGFAGPSARSVLIGAYAGLLPRALEAFIQAVR